MSEKFVIPIRSSSKKIKKRIASRELQDDRRKRRDALSDNIKVARQDLRPKTSFDSEYWDARADVESKSHQRTILHRQISCDDFSGDSDEWEDSALNHDLHAQERVHQTRERIFKQHADRLRLNENDPDFAKKSERRGFVELFTSSPQGLGIKLAAAGRRSTKLQSALRDDCEKKYKPRPAIGSPLVFCSMTGQYWHQDMVHAAHIFPHKHTQKLMIAIFGEESKGELWKAEDAILMTNTAEQHFDNGRFVIVPDIRDNATTDEIASWNQQEPKAYKIRVIATKTNLKELSQEITLTSDPEKMWKDLDGQKLVFKTDFRPRSRYLYFHYCTAILKKSWNDDKKNSALCDEMGKRYWGTVGRYMKACHIRGFIEEIGHEADELLEGACEENPEECKEETAAKVNRIGLLAATGTIEQARKKTDDECDEE